MSSHIEDQVTIVKGRPILKDIINFFGQDKNTRMFVTITDSTKVWQDDLVIAERMFADQVVLPVDQDPTTDFEQTVEVLKQRMKYPNIRESEQLTSVAKTWVLPSKLHVGPSADELFRSNEEVYEHVFEPLFREYSSEGKIHCLKVEVSGGRERRQLQNLFDLPYRPSLLIVKWSNDVDEDVLTANCAGHLHNLGYSLLSLNDNYALYLFTEQGIYDLCSLKETGLQNPFVNTILKSVSVAEKKETEATTEAIPA